MADSPPPAGASRAESPPQRYWRRWCEDAGPAAPFSSDPAPQPAPGRPSSPEPHGPTPQAAPGGPAVAPYRVLIVEDDVSQALFAESILMGAGMEAAVVLAEGALELAFQPVVAVAGGEHALYQTLLRLRDPSGALHTVTEILPVIAEAGLLHQYDQHVVQLTIELLRRCQREGKPVRLFVSQSPRTLAADGYAAWLVEALSLGEVAEGALVVDVRLDDALIHALSLEEFCAEMVPAGIQLCLSQYRTGEEAQALLARLPLSYVRLAAEYASGLEDPAVHGEMRTAIEHAHRLGLQVIGQQVDDPQAAATLWMSGVDFIQGNLVHEVGDGLDFDFQHSVL